MLNRLKQYISARIIRYLAQPTRRYAPFFAPDPEMTRRSLEPGDVVLIEGNTRLSAIIKFLTQSTWSHAALYVGERPGDRGPGHMAAPDLEANVLLEAEAEIGVTTVPLSKYAAFNTRICRPTGLEPARPGSASSTTRWRGSASNTTPTRSSILHAISFPIRRCRCGFAAACWRSAAAIRPRRSARR